MKPVRHNIIQDIKFVRRITGILARLGIRNAHGGWGLKHTKDFVEKVYDYKAAEWF